MLYLFMLFVKITFSSECIEEFTLDGVGPFINQGNDQIVFLVQGGPDLRTQPHYKKRSMVWGTFNSWGSNKYFINEKEVFLKDLNINAKALTDVTDKETQHLLGHDGANSDKECIRVFKDIIIDEDRKKELVEWTVLMMSNRLFGEEDKEEKEGFEDKLTDEIFESINQGRMYLVSSTGPDWTYNYLYLYGIDRKNIFSDGFELTPSAIHPKHNRPYFKQELRISRENLVKHIEHERSLISENPNDIYISTDIHHEFDCQSGIFDFFLLIEHKKCELF